MKTLHFETIINATPQKVWETMLGKETYMQWVGASWPGSSYKGEWKQGAKIRFNGADSEGGTLGEIIDFQPYSHVAIEHIAVLLEDGSEDRTSEMAKGWIGAKEAYTFTGEDGGTKVDIEISTAPEWSSMFEEGWPAALQELKRISEQ